jgi:hypothetical protein
MFHLYQTYVASVLIWMLHIYGCFKCFICFIRLLQAFHLDVAYACNGFQVFSGIFASVLNTCIKCFICLLCILQLLHLGVLKVDRGSHIGCAWEAADGAGDICSGVHGRRPGWRRPAARVLARSLHVRASSLARRYCPNASALEWTSGHF